MSWNYNIDCPRCGIYGQRYAKHSKVCKKCADIGRTHRLFNRIEKKENDIKANI